MYLFICLCIYLFLHTPVLLPQRSDDCVSNCSLGLFHPYSWWFITSSWVFTYHRLDSLLSICVAESCNFFIFYFFGEFPSIYFALIVPFFDFCVIVLLCDLFHVYLCLLCMFLSLSVMKKTTVEIFLCCIVFLFVCPPFVCLLPV